MNTFPAIWHGKAAELSITKILSKTMACITCMNSFVRTHVSTSADIYMTELVFKPQKFV